jgi:hypothetical protein
VSAGKTWRGPGSCPAEPPQSISQPVSRVLCSEGFPSPDGHSSATPVARRLEQPTRAAGPDRLGSVPAFAGNRIPRRPYSVLLPVGFAVPLPLPVARCALTAPFHPYRPSPNLRPAVSFSVALSLRPVPAQTGIDPAGCYPAPFVRGARTFLPGGLSALAGAAVRPTDVVQVGPAWGRCQWLARSQGALG